MANNISVTQGAGTLLTTDQCTADSSHMEVVKLAESVAGSRNYIPATVANGLLVNVSQVQGSVAVTGSVSITGTPAVTVTGVVSITGTPAVTVTGVVSITGTPAVTISGTPAVTVSGTAAVTQSGTWNIGTVATITNPVTVTGSVSISGTSTVAGTVTANQGTPAAIGNAWYVQLSDGAHAASLTNFAGSYALNVNVLGQVGGGVSLADLAAFTGGTTAATPIQGVFNDGLAAVGSGHVGAVRMSAYRGQHVNLRDSAGNELGLVGDPLYVQVTGGIQPVSGTVTANQGGAPWSFNHTQINGHAVIEAANGVQTVGIVNAAGTAFSATVPLQTQNAPSGATGQTPWRNHLVVSAGKTAAVVHTAAGGKTAYIEGYSINFVVAGTGTTGFTLFDNTNTALNTLWACQTPWAFLSVTVTPARPIPLSATGNSLCYTSGAAMVGDITVWGYDA